MFLKIKNIPKVSWSSDKPLNLKPKVSSFFFLCLGLTLFGLGEGLLIVSLSGASPWSVLAQGISIKSGLSVGFITFIISVSVLIFWIPLNQKPGVGTILNALIVAFMIDVCIKYFPSPESYLYQILLGAIAAERENISSYFAQAGLITLFLNVIMMVVAFYVAKFFATGLAQRKCITIECGLQNGTLAIAVAVTLFGGGVIVIPAATYSLIMFVTSLMFILMLRKSNV